MARAGRLRRQTNPGHTRSREELRRLRERVGQLSAEISALRKPTDDQSASALLKEANERLVLATFGAQDRQADVEAAMARQNAFLAMLAHELRNPLQPIAHANAILKKMGGSHPLLPRLNDIIGRQVVNLSRLVDDLLDASRISSGKINLRRTELAVSDMIGSAIELLAPQLEQRKQRLEVIRPPRDLYVYGDSLRLVQVFSNLLGNASKFSPEGSTIILTIAEVGAEVHIAVIDEGSGIDAELLPKVFDLFTQGAQWLDRSTGGLGIGLSLVRSLVEMHGGSVRAASAGAGQGSEFMVALPAVQPGLRAEQPSPDCAALERSLHILVVEDNPDANELLCRLLENEGHSVATCYDGERAIALATAEPPDVLLCDIGLPGLDGYAVVEGIRALGAARAPICIAVSGYNQLADRVRALSSGFDHYLVKPVDIDLLCKVIALHLR